MSDERVSTIFMNSLQTTDGLNAFQSLELNFGVKVVASRQGDQVTGVRMST